jgi:aspartate carbamoyltransferase catalytic subunit
MSQILSDGRLRHLLTLENMPRTMLETLLDTAHAMRSQAMGGVAYRDVLRGKTVCTLFFENSTRTRCSFLIAAQRLGADVLNFDAATSSAKKGETDLDTLKNIEAMGVDAFVIRHPDNGAVARLLNGAKPETVLINAGDGRHQHPTQGLLDVLTMRQCKGKDFSKLKILIAGDVLHSRVARSNISALKMLGAGEIRICGPKSLLPTDGTLNGCQVFDNFDEAITEVDVAMMLRVQRERMEQGLIGSLEDYYRDYGLSAARMQRAKPDAIAMHPGPMNRGVEISDEVADGPQSVIMQQVSNGVAVRMAVLKMLLG